MSFTVPSALHTPPPDLVGATSGEHRSWGTAITVAPGVRGTQPFTLDLSPTDQVIESNPGGVDDFGLVGQLGTAFGAVLPRPFLGGPVTGGAQGFEARAAPGAEGGPVRHVAIAGGAVQAGGVTVCRTLWLGIAHDIIPATPW